MGFNGQFLCCSTEGPDVAARLPATVRTFYEGSGARFVSATGMSKSAARDNPDLFGIAIAPPVEGWIAIADSDRRPSVKLAAYLASELATAVVISSIFEICDPIEPEQVQIFGAEPSDRFSGLYEIVGFHYDALVNARDAFSGRPPFDPDASVFATFRRA